MPPPWYIQPLAPTTRITHMATSTIELPAATLPTRSSRAVLRPLALATPLVLLLGALEGWFGKTDSGDVYGSDAVQYLDCARAISAHHWHTALNPLWSQGYPALLALTHTLFAVSPMGDWLTTRLLNLLIFAFCWLTFSLLLRELDDLYPLSSPILIAAAAVFLTAQVTLDQVSRVGPDQLLAAFFFLACALLLRLRRHPTCTLAAMLGLVLGLGFLTKAAFLVLGCAILCIAAIRRRVPHDHQGEAEIIVGSVTSARRLNHTRNAPAASRILRILPAAIVFVSILLGYGAALSHATGHLTLGEAGSLNYAWHVNRLAKWVHWQGGADPAEKAWPKASLARFAHWQTAPPDFGTPLHPTQQLGSNPTVLVFPSQAEATYPPYYDPAYFYQGYHHLFRWRYQLIALAKNTADLIEVLLKQPITYALALIAFLALTAFRRALRPNLNPAWPVAACALIGIALYLPVHLEGRYLSAFLAVLATLTLIALESRQKHRTALLTLFFVAATAGLIHSQAPIWSRALHHWSPRAQPGVAHRRRRPGRRPTSRRTDRHDFLDPQPPRRLGLPVRPAHHRRDRHRPGRGRLLASLPSPPGRDPRRVPPIRSHRRPHPGPTPQPELHLAATSQRPPLDPPLPALTSTLLPLVCPPQGSASVLAPPAQPHIRVPHISLQRYGFGGANTPHQKPQYSGRANERRCSTASLARALSCTSSSGFFRASVFKDIRMRKLPCSRSALRSRNVQ